MKNIVFRLGLLLVFIPMISNGQISILDDYVSQGLERNKNLRSHKMLHHAFLEKENQFSRLSELQVNVGYAPSPIETRLGAQGTQLSIVQQFPWFGVFNARKKLFRAENRIHEIVLEGLENDLEFSIKKLWFQLYETRLNKKLLSEKIDLIRSVENLAEEHLKNNSAFSLSDLIAIQIRRENLENSFVDLSDYEKRLSLRFNQLLSLPLNGGVETPDSLAKISTLSSAVEGKAISVVKQEAKLQAAKESVELIRKENKPSWTVGIKYFSIEERTDAIPADNGRDAYMVNLGLKIPFQLGQNRHRILEAEHKWHSEQLHLEHMEEEINLMVEEIKLNLKKSERNYALYEEQIRKLDQSIELALLNYTHGKQSYQKLLDTMDMTLDLERKRIASVVQQWIQLAYLKSLFDQKI